MKKINFKNINESVFYEKLPSGLNVYIYTTDKTSLFDMRLVVHVGSRDNSFILDNKEIHIPNGVAHFLEHLTFNTKDGSVEDYFAKKGAYVNASTTFDNTTYIVNCNDSFIDNLIYFLNFVTEPYYTKELVEKERGIILEEILMHMNNIDENLYYRFCDNVFINDPIKNRVGGTDVDVKNITLDDIVNTYNCFYKKNNMDLVITGNVDVNETLDKLIEWDTKENNNEIKRVYTNEPNKVNKEKDSYNDLVSSKRMMLGFKLPCDLINLNKIELNLYSSLLDDLMFGETSNLRLFCEKEDLFNDYVDSFIIDGYKHKVLTLEFESDDLDKAYDYLLNYIKNFKINVIDFKRKIKVLKSHLITSFENPKNVGGIICGNIVKYGRVVDNYYEIFDTLTIDKLNELLNLYRNSCFTYTKLLPKK